MEKSWLYSDRRPLYSLLGAFVLAVVHQYLFFGHDPAVSYPIFVACLYGYMYVFAKDKLRPFTWFGWLMFTAIMLLSLTYVLFSNVVFYVLNLLVIPALFFIHMAYSLSERRLDWSALKLVGDALDHVIVQSLRHVPTVFRVVRSTSGRSMDEGHKRTLGKVLIGLLISLPLLIIVISLLSSADGGFNYILSLLPNWLGRQVSFGEGTVRFLWVIFFGLLFFMYLWGFIDFKRYESEARTGDALEERLAEWAADVEKPRLDPVITATVLIAINMVYVLFVAIQFSYLFGAGQGLLPEGQSYAEYARSGFLELVVVTAINFTIMLLVMLLSGEEKGLVQSMNRVMLYVLLACSGVMLYSGYQRLLLYEEMYGYTYTRFLVHAFMIFLGLLLIIAGCRIRWKQIPLAKCYIVLGLCAYVLMNYIGMDQIIAEKNIQRYRETGRIDAVYLSNLSVEATPKLIDFSKEYPAMRGYLQERYDVMTSRGQEGWQSFNLSQYRAMRNLEDALGEVAFNYMK